MDIPFLGITVYVAVLILLPFYRVLFGPTLFDRVIGAGLIGTKEAVLLVVLGKFAWRPLLANLKAREEQIRQQLDMAAQANRHAQTVLDQARQQAVKIVEQAREQAQKTQEEIIRQAKEELAVLRHEAEAEITHAKMAAIEAVWQQSTQIVQALTEQVLGRTVDRQDCEQLIRQATEWIRTEKDPR